MFHSAKFKQYLPTLYFFLIYTAVFLAVVFTMKYTFPFIAGFLLAMALQPLVRLLTARLHCKAGIASMIATLLLFLVLFGLLFLAGFSLISEIKSLIQQLAATDLSKIKEPILSIFDRAGNYINQIDAEYITQNKEQIMSVAAGGVSLLSTLLTGVLRFLTSIPAIFTMIIVMIFSTYFFSKDMPRIKEAVVSQFTSDTMVQINSATNHGVSMMGKYISSYMLIYFITFLESLLIFYALRVPYPLVLSIVCGVADIIPILGPGTVYIPLAIFMAFQQNYFAAVGLIISWLLITVVREVIEPKIVSSSIEIHPLAMLAALYVSLISGSFLVLLYFTILFILYQILKKVDILKPIFPNLGKEELASPSQAVNPFSAIVEKCKSGTKKLPPKK